VIKLTITSRLGKKRHWFYCSDTHVSNVEEKDALNAEAYILFYRRCTNPDEAKETP
jgi:ubiquitin C-terminal hydrolase